MQLMLQKHEHSTKYCKSIKKVSHLYFYYHKNAKALYRVKHNVASKHIGIKYDYTLTIITITLRGNTKKLYLKISKVVFYEFYSKVTGVAPTMINFKFLTLVHLNETSDLMREYSDARFLGYSLYQAISHTVYARKYISRNIHIVLLSFLLWLYHLWISEIYLFISFRVASLALGQS